MYTVIIGAEVLLTGQSGGTTDEDERFRTLYPETPKLVDGVFKLLAQGAFTYNMMGTETEASRFAGRNQRYIVSIVRGATPKMLDVCAKRMNDLDSPGLRLIYAGILAACNDQRGRDFLINAIMGAKNPDPSAIYVLGAFSDWARSGDRECEIGWVEEPALHCFQDSPWLTTNHSNLARLLMHMKSERGRKKLMDLVVEPPPPPRDANRIFGGSNHGELLAALLADHGTTLSVEDLARLASAFPQPSGFRRQIAAQLFARDEPIAAELFLRHIAESFWYPVIRENVGPRVLAEIRKRASSLSPEGQDLAECLMIRGSEDPVAGFIRRLEDSQTPIDHLVHICWELEDLGDPRAAVPIADALTSRLLEPEPGEEAGTFAVVSVIGWLGTFDTPGAVVCMVDLLDADFSPIVSEFLSADELRSHVAGQLAEMTGEGFGTDSAIWREFLER